MLDFVILVITFVCVGANINIISYLRKGGAL